MPRRIMVPLNGTESAENALAFVEHLQDKRDLEVLLVSVWEADERFLGGDPVGRARVPLVLDCITRNLGSYLSEVEERLKRQGIHACSRVLPGQPSRDLLALAERENAEIVIGSGVLAGPRCQYPRPRWCHGPCPLLS